ncbi:response regulator transcription factor [Martelella sp. HB161492]|uniref:response regulator transcription factor n=1 Tax=Martelella sp. HB161492 TaxID=2720726 RepID=UPI0015911ED2|nr:response regulator transcription factor [Martelella sp. HB161492]
MSTILVIEDEAFLRTDLVDYLCLHGYEAVGVETAAAMQAVLDTPWRPNVIILDIALPDGNGFNIARRLRETDDAGIIMLTAHGDAESRVRGFESGADIYLVKNTSLREILAAVQSLLRRLPRRDGETKAGREWVLDNAAWQLVSPEGKHIRLTATERDFLSVLIESAGNPCSREMLYGRLATRQTPFDNRHLDAVVSRLRRKIENEIGTETPIRSTYGIGYSFSAPARIKLGG